MCQCHWCLHNRTFCSTQLDRLLTNLYTHLYCKLHRLVFLIQRVYGQLRSVLSQFLTAFSSSSSENANKSRKPPQNDQVRFLEGQYPQQCCDASLGMLAGEGEPEQTGFLLPDLCLCTWSHQFVLDGVRGVCAERVVRDPLSPAAVIRGDKCPPADTGGWRGRRLSWGGRGTQGRALAQSFCS